MKPAVGFVSALVAVLVVVLVSGSMFQVSQTEQALVVRFERRWSSSKVIAVSRT